MNKKKCPFCAEEINEDALQCPLCGATLPSLSENKTVQEKKCPFCGEMIDGNASTCPECDSVLSSPSSRQGVVKPRNFHVRTLLDADSVPTDSTDWSFDSKIALGLGVGGLLLSLLPWPFWLKIVFILLSLLGGGFGMYILKKMTPEEKLEPLRKLGMNCKCIVAIFCAIIVIFLSFITFGSGGGLNSKLEGRLTYIIQSKGIEFLLENMSALDKAFMFEMYAAQNKQAREELRKIVTCEKITNFRMASNNFSCKALVTFENQQTKMKRKFWIDVQGEMIEDDLIVYADFLSATLNQ